MKSGKEEVGTEQNIGNVSWNVVEKLGTIDEEFIKKKIVTEDPPKP